MCSAVNKKLREGLIHTPGLRTNQTQGALIYKCNTSIKDPLVRELNKSVGVSSGGGSAYQLHCREGSH
jgi:hypothetical protein